MGGTSKGGEYPMAPDPKALSEAQFDLNKRTALLQGELNRVNQRGPQGSMTYKPVGKPVNGVQQYEMVSTLSPQMQKMWDLQNSTGLKLMQGVGKPINFNGMPTVDSVGSMGPINDASRQRVEDALYARMRGKLDPVYDKQQTDLETRLANQGFDISSAGYRGAVDDFSRNRSDAYGNAVNDAILAGGQEESRQVGLAGSEQSRIFGLQSADRERAIQEYMLGRTGPLNEYMALMGGGGVQLPQFGGAPQTGVSPADITGPTAQQYQGEVNAYNQNQNSQNSLWGNIFGLGGKALGAWLSSSDAKTDKRPINTDKVLDGVRRMPMKSYRYKASGNPNMGPMSQDFSAAFGGDEHTIEVPRAFGVTLASIQALANKVDALERRAA